MLENIRWVREQICDTADLEAESQRLMEEMNMLSDRVQKCISENARSKEDISVTFKDGTEIHISQELARGKVPCQFSCIPFLFYGRMIIM